MSTDIYTNLVKTTEEYLGPTSERFIKRQVEAHLKKDPTALEDSDIPILADWIKVSFSVISGDKNTVDTYISKILKIPNK